MPLLAAPGVFATRSPDVGSTIDELVNSSLPVVAERGDVCTGRVRSILAMMLAILPKSVGSRVHFVECPSTARIGTRVAAPEPAGSWSLPAVAAGPIRHPNVWTFLRDYGVPQGVPTQGNTWATTLIGDRHSVIRAPRSGRILPRRDPIFELVNTVVNEVCKRAFSARRLIWSAGGRDAASAKKWQDMRPSILTIHRTVTTRRADFAVRLIRRDRRAPLMMLVHEECRITCDHRHSLWYLTGS